MDLFQKHINIFNVFTLSKKKKKRKEKAAGFLSEWVWSNFNKSRLPTVDRRLTKRTKHFRFSCTYAVSVLTCFSQLLC